MMNTDSVGGDGDDGVDDDDDEGNPVLWFPAIACRPFAKLLSHQATGGMRIICIVMIPILITSFMSLMSFAALKAHFFLSAKHICADIFPRISLSFFFSTPRHLVSCVSGVYNLEGTAGGE